MTRLIRLALIALSLRTALTAQTLTVTDPVPVVGYVGNTYGSVFDSTNGVSIPSFVQVSASGGAAPYTYAIELGQLPPGLVLNPTTGRVQGIPTGGGGTFVQGRVIDNQGRTALFLIPAINVINPPTRILRGTVGSSFRTTTNSCGTAGGTGFTYTVNFSQSFGLGFDAATRTLSGEPNRSGTFLGTNSCFNSNLRFTWSMEIRVDRLPAYTLSAATKDQPYSFVPPDILGGVPPFTFSVIGNLPPGIRLQDANTGQLSGTPTAAGTTIFRMRRTDREGNYRTAECTLRVNVDPIANPDALIAPTTQLTLHVPENSEELVIAPFLIQAGRKQRFRLSFAGAGGSGANGFEEADLVLSPREGETDNVIRAILDTSFMRAGQDLLVYLDVSRQGPNSTWLPPELTLSFQVIVESTGPRLEVSPREVLVTTNEFNLFEAATGYFYIDNSGGGTLDPVVSPPRILNGGNWLTDVSVDGTEVTRQRYVTVAVTVDPQRLGGFGTFVAEIDVSAQGQPTITVRIVVDNTPPSDRTQITVTGVSDIEAPLGNNAPRTMDFRVDISNPAPGAIWSADLLQITRPGGWLTLSNNRDRPSGTSFTATVNLQGLEMNAIHTAWVRIETPSVRNPRTYVSRDITLTVQIKRSVPPVVSPSTLILPSRRQPAPTQGGADFNIIPLGGGTFRYSVTSANSPNNPSNTNFFRVTEPQAGEQLEPNVLRKVPVTQGSGEVPVPGYYNGTVTFRFTEPSDPAQIEYQATKRVFQLVGWADEPVPATPTQAPPAADFLAGSSEPKRAAGTSCTSLPLQVLTDLQPLFQTNVGRKTVVKAAIFSGCGQNFTTGSVDARFSNGDPSVRLRHTANGVWQGEWTARNPGDVVTVTVTATDGKQRGSDSVDGRVLDDGLAILLDGRPLRHAATTGPIQSITPGMLVSIVGSRLTDGSEAQNLTSTPVTTLAGASVEVNGERVSLWEVSSTRILAQIPASVVPGTYVQLLVQRTGGFAALIDNVFVAPAAPGILTPTGIGSGQGSIFSLRGSTRSLAAQPQGAQGGDTVAIEVTGLGTINQPVDANSGVRVMLGSSSTPIVPVRITPSTTKPGVSDVVFRVPIGFASSADTRVQIDAGGFRSQAVTMSILPGTASCITNVSPAQLQLGAASSSSTLTITAPSGCAWTATAGAAWLSVNPASGNGNGSITLQVQANAAARRLSALTLSGLTIDIEQAGLNEATVTGVVHGATFTSGISSGMWISILGTNLSSTTRSWTGADFSGNSLPTVLDGVSVKINGRDAHPAFISPTQLNVLTPDDSTLGPVNVVVSRNGVPSFSFTAERRAITPGLFRYGVEGGRYVAAIHSDGAFVTRDNLFPGAFARPAAPGDIIALYGTGCGPTNPSLDPSRLVAAPASLTSTVTATVGGVPATVVYSGIVSSGLCQVNVTIPSVGSGDREIILNVGGVSSGTGAFVTVK